jgi:hypothetical protein
MKNVYLFIQMENYYFSPLTEEKKVLEVMTFTIALEDMKIGASQLIWDAL